MTNIENTTNQDFNPFVGLGILDTQIKNTQNQIQSETAKQQAEERARVQNTLQAIKEHKVDQIQYLPKIEDLHTDQQIELGKLRDTLGLKFIKEPSPSNLIQGLEAQNKAIVNQQFVPSTIKSYQDYQTDIAKRLPSLEDIQFKFNPSSFLKIPEQGDNTISNSNGADTNLAQGDWLDPIDGLGQITSTHLQARSGTGTNGAVIGANNGIDIGVSEGTPIKAMQDGIVMGSQTHKDKSGKVTGYGNVVTVQTKDGMQYSFAHMKDPALFRDGDTVKKGDVVGYVGHTGTATGDHLSLQMGYGQFNPQTGYYITSTQAKDSKLATNPLDFIRNTKDNSPLSQSTEFTKYTKFRNILDAGLKNPVANKIYDYFAPKYGAEVAQKMTVIANLEGGWKPDTAVANSGEQSFGTFQINLNAHNDKVAKYTGTTNKATNAKWLSDLNNSLKIAEQIYKGNGFKDWTTAHKSVKTYMGTLGNGIINF